MFSAIPYSGHCYLFKNICKPHPHVNADLDMLISAAQGSMKHRPLSMDLFSLHQPN